MKDEIVTRLSVLLGERFYGGHRAASMVTLGFGPLRTVAGRKGPRELHRFALHVQCPWRLSRDGLLLVGSDDRFWPATGVNPNDPDVDLDSQGANRWDEQMARLRAEAENVAYVVEHIDADAFGGLVLRMSQSVVLEVFPTATAPDRGNEHWRFFETGTDRAHFVVTPAGIDG